MNCWEEEVDQRIPLMNERRRTPCSLISLYLYFYYESIQESVLWQTAQQMNLHLLVSQHQERVNPESEAVYFSRTLCSIACNKI